MTQQINLYQPILRREKKVFSAAMMLQFLGVVAVLMLALYAFNRWQLSELQAERERLQAQERELAGRVAELSRGTRSRPESRELRSQVEEAQREELLKRRLADMMLGSPAGDGIGFSDAFAGLARQRIPGLWLTGIELHKEGAVRDVTLRGMTADAERVPQLLQQLGKERAFQGLRFRHMRVYRPERAVDNSLAFELSTLPQDETSE